LYFIK